MIEYQVERESCKDAKRKRELDTLIKRAYNNQQVRKIALNSAYGALANQWFAFFSVDLAEAITTSGQLIIQWGEKTINDWLNQVLKTEDKDYVIAIDTDSLYITLDDLVKQVFPEDTPKAKIIDFINTIAEDTIEPVLAKGYDKLAKDTNAFQQKMQMGREVIADRGIWTAKKRYILNVHDNEGVRLREPKLKMMGIETAKSSTPQWVRQKLTDAFGVVITEQNKTYGSSWKKHEETLERYRLRKSHSLEVVVVLDNTRIEQLSTVKTPIHVRGALVVQPLTQRKES